MSRSAREQAGNLGEGHAAQIHIPSLDVVVTPTSADQVIEWIDSGTAKSLLLNHNLHSAYLHSTDEKFRSLYARADRILIDGMPILLLARRLSTSVQVTRDHRIGSTDWIAGLPALSGSRRIALLGASAASNADAVRRLQADMAATSHEIIGLDGYAPAHIAVEWLNQQQPDVVLVGLGMPLQEHFLYSHWAELPPATYATVGGAIDYVSGHNRLAPRWIGRIGFEWAWRLAHEPRRLAHRYIVEPMRLIRSVIRRSLRRGAAAGSNIRKQEP